MKKFFEKFTPIGVIIGYALMVVVTNWVPGTLLSGGDNLHPEFNFGLNIWRSIFAVWQEYQGVGLLGGMGHGADLIRQLFLWFLSIFLPMEFLRYVWIMLMLMLGGLGAYALSMFLLAKNEYQGVNQRLASMSVGLFYMLNLGTLQSFYIPFEAFTAHFGFLPWLLLESIKFILTPSKSNWWLLLLIFLLSAPSGVVPTLFVVYWIIFAILLIGVSVSTKFSGGIKKVIVVVVGAIGAFLLSNGYWVFQFAYFTFKNSHINVSSRINQMATQNIYLQNKEFGDISNVLQMKGFWFQGFEPNLANIQSYIMQPWINHLNNPIVSIFSWGLVGLIGLGWLLAVFNKNKTLRVFGVVAFILFGFMATATLPFEYINDWFRNNLPLFGQIFRFTFTKFSIALSLFYSLMIGVSLCFLTNRYDKILGKLVSRTVITGIFLILLGVVSSPIFQGEFFYERTQVSRPEEYQQVINYLQDQAADVRVANFPQNSFWSWQYYKWGYVGSGFWWYGIPQPILDRAFDPWSKYSENYYLEITEAVYGRNGDLLQSVFDKYQIGFILIDENVVDNFSPRVTYYSELKEILGDMKGVTKANQFGNISIYKVSLARPAHGFVRMTNKLPSVNSYSWSSYDNAYLKKGDYQTSLDKEIFFPFRNLVTHKSNAIAEYKMTESDSAIVLEKDLIRLSGQLNLGSWFDDEVRTMYRLSVQEIEGRQMVRIEFLFPTVEVGDRRVGGVKSMDLYAFNGQTIQINTSEGMRFEIKDASYKGYGFVLNNEDSEFLIRDDLENLLANVVISKESVKSLSELTNIAIADNNQRLVVEIPKYLDSQNGYNTDFSKFVISSCDLSRRGEIKVLRTELGYQIWSKNAKACLSVDYPGMWHNQGFVSIVDSYHQRGLPLLYWINNNTNDYQPINMYLNGPRQFLVMPPMEDLGVGYSFHFDNTSIGKEETQNNIVGFNVYPIPYNWLLNMEINNYLSGTDNTDSLSIEKMNTSMYRVIYGGFDQSKVIILEQAYDSGWVAYNIGPNPNWLKIALPMVFGRKVDNHFEVNNLVNGWEVNSKSNTTFIIIYLPQYLQFVGFGLLGLTIGVGIVVAYRKLARRIARRNSD